MSKQQQPSGAPYLDAFSLWSPSRTWREMNDGREAAYFESEEDARMAATLLRDEDETARFAIRRFATPTRTAGDRCRFLYYIAHDWASAGQVITTDGGDVDEAGNLPGHSPAPIEER